MPHLRKKTLQFYTLACPDCGSPLINHDDDGVEYVLAFRNTALAEIEATDMAESDGTGKPGIIEVELSIVNAKNIPSP
jgi:hypothetical protein